MDYPQSNLFGQEAGLGELLLESNRYWEGKRLLFNGIVGAAGIANLILLGRLSLSEFLGALLWGFLANALYSVGYVLESVVLVRTNGRSDLKDWRELLFWAGTMLYALATLGMGIFYGIMSAI